MLDSFFSQPPTDRQRYFALLALVCESMPHYAVDNAIRAGYAPSHSGRGASGSDSTRLNHVKQGKVVSLPDLVALVRHSMPDFDVPAFLLPAEPVLA